jgi:hypothetical protein
LKYYRDTLINYTVSTLHHIMTITPISNLDNGPKFSFKVVSKNTNSNIQPINTFKFKVKTKQPKSQYALFVELCNKHSLPYFQFYDEDSWRGPVTKVLQEDFYSVMDIFEATQNTLKTIVLHGYGFVIIKPIQKMDDTNIHYPSTHFEKCKMTSHPIIPYNSDMDESESDMDLSESDMDVDEDSQRQEPNTIIVEEEFVPEEWKYNNTIFLLDPSTNYVYSPSTLEFVGKKTSEFSIDYDAKEY